MPKLIRHDTGWGHWCPGCSEVHVYRLVADPLQPNAPVWTFNGNMERPTFRASMLIRGKQIVLKDGKWTGEWHRGPDGKALDLVCHYFLTDGEIQYLNDCTHFLCGQTLPLPELPDYLQV